MDKLQFIGLFVLGLIAGFFFGSIPLSSADIVVSPLTPTSRINQSDISVYREYVQINIPNMQWAEIASTNSMLPVLNGATHVLQKEPTNPEELVVGDIISYRVPSSEFRIIHRIISINTDEDGWYAITKGDNNQIPDPEKVRFEQIERVLVAILY